MQIHPRKEDRIKSRKTPKKSESHQKTTEEQKKTMKSENN